MVGPIIVAAVVVFILIMFFSFVPVGLWISSMASGVRVGIFTLIGMRLRRVVPARIILPLIKATKAGIALQVNQLEAHYLAGGNVDGVVDALIAAERAGIDLPFEKAAAIDLAGRNVLEAVKMSVNPKVIETPNISAVAKDGIELLVKARVTVRTNLERLVGGAGEATIIARIGEGIVTTVGSAAEHKRVLENPDDISKLVFQRDWMRELHLKFFRLILPMSISDEISVRIYRAFRQKPTRILHRQRQRNAVQWQLQRNRKCALTL